MGRKLYLVAPARGIVMDEDGHPLFQWSRQRWRLPLAVFVGLVMGFAGGIGTFLVLPRSVRASGVSVVLVVAGLFAGIVAGAALILSRTGVTRVFGDGGTPLFVLREEKGIRLVPRLAIFDAAARLIGRFDAGFGGRQPLARLEDPDGRELATARKTAEPPLPDKVVERLGFASAYLDGGYVAIEGAAGRIGEVRTHSVALGGSLLRLTKAKGSGIDRTLLVAFALAVALHAPVAPRFPTLVPT